MDANEGNSWPEQDVIDQWLDDWNIDIPFSASIVLKEAVTQIRTDAVKHINGKLEATRKEMEKCEEISKKYYELLYGVASKFPDESRHETALRYILNAEKCGNNAEQTKQSEVDDGRD